MLKKYGILLLVIAVYIVHFAIPIFSIGYGRWIAGRGNPSVLDFMSSMGFHTYHYMSIGVMPFLISGLLSQFMLWQAPEKNKSFFVKIQSGFGGRARDFEINPVRWWN